MSHTPQAEAPRITTRDIIKIAVCLAATCFFASIILGGAYYFTEPVRQKETVRSEAATVRKLLNLGEGSDVTEVRRYIREQPSLEIGYLSPTELRLVNGDGALIKTIPVPESLRGKSAEDLNLWVAEQEGAHYAGRFFIGNSAGKLAGYVAESSQYGFKSPIRFFVALTPDFQVRGVEVVSHEEDPGLGAEIVRPQFKNQFAGRKAENLPTLDVTKDPLPADRKKAALALDTTPYDVWIKEYDPANTPIYAVTGATISSRALTEGVKKAVSHLQYRVGVVQRSSPPH